jgi:hypothetical protein
MLSLAVAAGIIPGSSGCISLLLGNSCCCSVPKTSTAAPVQHSCCAKHTAPAPVDSTESENLKTRCLTHPRPCCPLLPNAELTVAIDSAAPSTFETTLTATPFETIVAIYGTLPEATAAANLCGPPLHPPDTPLFLATHTLLI